ncbi:hypothetical protein K439DRAFT_1365641, partial [Ramaria rubella]
GTKGQISKLARIQRMATLHITGAMCTSPIDSVEAYANLLPFSLLVYKVVHRATSRMACLPPSHPLHRHVWNAAAKYVCCSLPLPPS